MALVAYDQEVVGDATRTCPPGTISNYNKCYNPCRNGADFGVSLLTPQPKCAVNLVDCLNGINKYNQKPCNQDVGGELVGNMSLTCPPGSSVRMNWGGVSGKAVCVKDCPDTHFQENNRCYPKVYPDNDGDGIADNIDQDDNNNGINDNEECGTGQRWDDATQKCVPITCPAGYQLEGNDCKEIVCPEGTKLYGNTCINDDETGDNDGDGIANNIDDDDDNDGIKDVDDNDDDNDGLADDIDPQKSTWNDPNSSLYQRALASAQASDVFYKDPEMVGKKTTPTTGNTNGLPLPLMLGGLGLAVIILMRKK